MQELLPQGYPLYSILTRCFNIVLPAETEMNDD